MLTVWCIRDTDGRFFCGWNAHKQAQWERDCSHIGIREYREKQDAQWIATWLSAVERTSCQPLPLCFKMKDGGGRKQNIDEAIKLACERMLQG